MSTIQVIIYTLLYIMAGSAVFWLIEQEDRIIKKKLRKRYPEKAEEVVEQYEQFAQWKPKGDSIGTLFKISLIGFVTAILVWALWPIVAIISAIWCLVKYWVMLHRFGD